MMSRWKRFRLLLPRWLRKSVYDSGVFLWHFGLVPPTIMIRGKQEPHPALHSGVFVVHGIGQQEITETAALLRSGFDDALAQIERWQIWHEKRTIPDEVYVPPPYILDGHWANYNDIESTFESDWSDFDDEAKLFFKNLWKNRVQSKSRTYRWFLRQQLRLLNPKVAIDVGVLAWLLYWPFQITSFVTLTLALLLRPKIVSGFLADVRLYVDPQGVTGRAIVQQIDKRVGARFLQMLGIDWEFVSLDSDDERICFKNEPIEFDRIVWVAHSLGSVISYNVLSDLFYKAGEIEHSDSATEQQREGVRKFRRALRRFVTMGSPLDKVAYLFGRRALRQWPQGESKKLVEGEGGALRNWWVNFYHILDPVSGALESEFICGTTPPVNEHIGLFHLPGWAHVSYWTDTEPLRYILSRTYGKNMLEDKPTRKLPSAILTATGLLFIIVQVLLPFVLVGVLLDVLGVISFSHVAGGIREAIESLWAAAVGIIGGNG